MKMPEVQDPHEGLPSPLGTRGKKGEVSRSVKTLALFSFKGGVLGMG